MTNFASNYKKMITMKQRPTNLGTWTVWHTITDGCGRSHAPRLLIRVKSGGGIPNTIRCLVKEMIFTNEKICTIQLNCVPLQPICAYTHTRTLLD